MIYGDQLAFFTEQFRRVDYFKMSPEVVSSYTKREPLGKVTGVFQFVKRGELLKENDVLSDVNVPTFWTRKKLEVGNFLTFDEVDYRITSDFPWFFEGGFYCYGLETLSGASDKQAEFTYVNLGQNDYD